MGARRRGALAPRAGIFLVIVTVIICFRYYRFDAGYDWSQHAQRFPVAEADMTRPPQGPPLRQGRVQYRFPRAAFVAPDARLASRREAVRDAFLRCWNSYKEHAWGYDELAPVSLKGKTTFGGWAATLVDSLDALLIMGLDAEFNATLPVVGALDWARTADSSINVFETTIRHLGGLLSAYDLSGERVLLLKAIELGDMLYMAFDTPNRMPPFWLNFAQAKAGTQRAGAADPSAAPTSLSLELTRLSQLTGNPKYFDATDRVKKFLARTQETTQLPGMWPVQMDFANERAWESRDFTLGALADSLYEYLPKMSALLGGHDAAYERMYTRAMDVVERHLLFRPMLPHGDDILFSGNARVLLEKEGVQQHVELVPEGQHLGCFAGGMFGLGGKLFGIEKHVEIGERLARGCAWAYDAFAAGVMPEIFGMIPCPSIAEGSIESVFLLYRMTGKAEYQEMAWRMFLAVQNATSTEHANSAILDVTIEASATGKLDSMESFFMAETLKYFYLVFSPPDLISLDQYVFNTEAHPLRRPKR
ncbi:family 47 glycosyl hydrolase [Podospora didyma]|uniref:alpha-1,2-Mannosidase n=1 Tax=Podospora didyma TaxID=330526 RepID=A0AAE0U1G8_9PEZI|nr:family 47 glycosyl hydrolase [Podospora didyma]